MRIENEFLSIWIYWWYAGVDSIGGYFGGAHATGLRAGFQFIMSASYTRAQLEKWLKTIDVKADRVLDIGSSQNGIKGRTKSFEVVECVGLDLKNPHQGGKADIVLDINEPIEFI